MVLFLALEKAKSGTETNSPAYIHIYIYICAVGRGFGPLEAFFFCKKMFLATESSILSKGILSNMRRTKFPVFGDQIPWLMGPNSLTYFFPWNTLPSTFASIPRNPNFCRFVFWNSWAFTKKAPKWPRNACQKECYYLVSEPRGSFLCWDQIPSCAKFAVLPVGMLKPVTSPETPIFMAFSEFFGIGIFWRARPPPLYFLPHFPVSPFLDPKKCQKNSQTRGANSTLFFDPYFCSVFWPFLPKNAKAPFTLPKNAKAPFTLISVVLLLTPETTIFLVFSSPCTKKEGDQIPLLHLPR